MEKRAVTGLGNSEQSFPRISASALSRPAIERLVPGSDLHANVLSYLTTRLKMSEMKMSEFYPRWRLAEMRHQAYINLPDYEKRLKEISDAGGPPELTSVVVPYTFATINTIVTYLVNAFTGRKPMFQLGTYKAESMNAVSYMELMLQHNVEHSRLVRQLYQFLNDGQLYGVGILVPIWTKDVQMRTIKKKTSFLGIIPRVISTREARTVYEGNVVRSIDPFLFFPDPRVPMADVCRQGEFVFWRAFTGKHELLVKQAQGKLRNVDRAGSLPADSRIDSNRTLLPTNSTSREVVSAMRDNTVQEDTGAVKIIPAELGLGTSQVPETWIFTILNKQVIAQAQPLEYDHGMLPVVVHEPYTTGYGFGHNSMADFLAPIQDGLSWFINSHIYNVRATLNNSYIVDPSKVEMQDLKSPKPGKLIRLKPTAIGSDVRTVIQQLQAADVTAGHVNDFATFMRLGDVLSSVNDNMRGLTDAGSRKTATEVRTSAEAGSSRLAALARLVSSQAIVDLEEQMAINIMQFMSEDYTVRIVGEKGNEELVNISPEMVIGDFYFPVHDGSLPIDKVAMLDVWKEILFGVAQDPQLRQQYDVGKIFAHVAELGGARDIDKFKIQAVPDQVLQQQVQAGNVIPMPMPMGGPDAAGG